MTTKRLSRNLEGTANKIHLTAFTFLTAIRCISVGQPGNRNFLAHSGEKTQVAKLNIVANFVIVQARQNIH